MAFGEDQDARHESVGRPYRPPAPVLRTHPRPDMPVFSQVVRCHQRCQPAEHITSTHRVTTW